jgi:lipoate-protein ligase A
LRQFTTQGNLCHIEMKLLDLALPTPAENLAVEEAWLDAAEAGEAGEVLRFWEFSGHFVVVGYANKVATEVNVPACEARGIPVLRRCSGGGTVLQGPGCLNYALVLEITADGPLRNISSANQFIMERNRAALQAALNRPVAVQGHTDLTHDGLKFSGNSQRRRRHYLMFHGTFLLNFELALLEAVLRPPTQQPEYRRQRSHTEFVTNLNVPAATVKAALANAWEAKEPGVDFPRERMTALVHEKYATPAWSFKF